MWESSLLKPESLKSSKCLWFSSLRLTSWFFNSFMSLHWLASPIWKNLHRIIQWMTEHLVGSRIVDEMWASCFYSNKRAKTNSPCFHLFISFCATAPAAWMLMMLTNLGERTLPYFKWWLSGMSESENYFLLPCSLLGLDAKQNIYVGSIQIMI